MSLFDKLFGKKSEIEPCITETESHGVFHNYELNKKYVKEIFDMLRSVSSYNSDKYEVSTDHSHMNSYILIFYAVIEKIKIEISYSRESHMTPVYEIESIKFKNELIFTDNMWLCEGPIQQGIYDILEEFKLLIEKEKERDRQLQNEKYEKYKLEQKKRCEQINREFLELKRSK
jgi:hypothetical protein